LFGLDVELAFGGVVEESRPKDVLLSVGEEVKLVERVDGGSVVRGGPTKGPVDAIRCGISKAAKTNVYPPSGEQKIAQPEEGRCRIKNAEQER